MILSIGGPQLLCWSGTLDQSNSCLPGTSLEPGSPPWPVVRQVIEGMHNPGPPLYGACWLCSSIHRPLLDFYTGCPLKYVLANGIAIDIALVYPVCIRILSVILCIVSMILCIYLS